MTPRWTAVVLAPATQSVPAEQDKPEAPKAPDVSAEVKTLNAKTAPWVYQLPDYKLRTLEKSLADLTKPKDKRPPPPAE